MISTALQTHSTILPISDYNKITVDTKDKISVSIGNFHTDFISDIDADQIQVFRVDTGFYADADFRVDTGFRADADFRVDTGSLIFGNILGVVIEKHSISRLQIIDEQLEILSQIKENSDNQGFKAPSETTLTNAREIMKHLLERVDYEQCPWTEPFIYSDEFSYVSMEWHQENRALHFDIKENDMRYTRIWGKKDNVESETSNLSIHNCLSLWKWLIINEQS